MAAPVQFWDRIAEKYARRPVADEATYERKLAVTREYLTLESVVLEFGCGTGSTAIAHAPFVKQVDATDLSPAMIGIAKRKAEEAAAGNVCFRVASIEDLEAQDGRYDMVMAHSILHLLRDQEAAVARAYALLKPGGIFVSSTACLGDFAWYFRLFLLSLPVGRRLGFFPYVKSFTRPMLTGSMRAAGFTIVEEWQPGKNKAVFIVARKA